MLTRITTLPKDKRIAGVHCIPITETGSIMMAWDKDELILTTIGGRIEENESLDEALEREAMEEVGIILDSNRIPFASWYWQGYVIFNFETAKQIVSKIESNNDKRVQILKMAEERAKNLSWI
ncbi:NUDIX domain-containing protein [Psychrobacillus sp. PGGUH221]|uniref:NUDIX hydrolase n=1 Tax=Psychrobacillus sp. PGGUH221 TaxID=3020058 RepID=UPI0035C6EDEC